jgi:hypothetical protein
MMDKFELNGVAAKSQLEVEGQSVKRAARTNKPASKGVRPKEMRGRSTARGKKGTVNKDITKVKIGKAKVPWTEEFLEKHSGGNRDSPYIAP